MKTKTDYLEDAYASAMFFINSGYDAEGYRIVYPDRYLDKALDRAEKDYYGIA